MIRLHPLSSTNAVCVRSASGFTLIELLVAMAIFAFLAVMMYGGTQWIIQEREVVLERLGELEDLQRAVRLLNEDFAQIYPRAVRDELGRGNVPALVTERGSEPGLQLTRAGWRNPANLPRSNLQRVRYRYDEDEGTLYRESWPVLDRVLGMEPRKRKILTGLTAFTVEFLDPTGGWQQDWPAVSAIGLTSLPQAVRYRFELKSFGTITRLLELPG